MSIYLADFQRKNFPKKFFYGVVLIIIIFGIYIRFANLERKVFWNDECLTLLRVSGYANSELIEKVFNGKLITVKELQNYQTFNSQRNINDVFNALSRSPEHSPLYYLILRYWIQLFGSSVATIRMLSALISLLVFPSIYWLSWELFNSHRLSLFSIIFIAVSPFHVIYAQEARPYSLWTVTILLSSAALLYALSSKKQLSWIAYTATLILGLYTSILSVIVMAAQGFYILVRENLRIGKNFINYLICILITGLAFTPWLSIVEWSEFKSTNAIATRGLSILVWIKIFFLNLTRIVYDQEINKEGYQLYLQLLIMIIIFLSLFYSLLYVYKKASYQSSMFVIILAIFTLSSLILPDLLLGGRRSSVSRYLIPCYLGFQLSYSYYLGNEFIKAINFGKRKLLQISILMVLLLGMLSTIFYSQEEFWWNKYISQHNPEISVIVNQTESPLLISDGSVSNMLSLSRLLNKDIKLQLFAGSQTPYISKEINDFNDIYLFNISRDFKNKFEQKGYKTKKVFQQEQTTLYKLEK
ncbi:MAG: glycosyltransferase family 39 protein [Microcoleaceae cyanobacterium]